MTVKIGENERLGVPEEGLECCQSGVDLLWSVLGTH